jgi:hypothetical protein
MEKKQLKMGKVSPTEVATWKRASWGRIPDSRYLHAATFDEFRKVMLVFGGMAGMYGLAPTASNELWEWNPATGIWTPRTPTGEKPAARSGATMVYDSIRDKVVLFGGRA